MTPHIGHCPAPKSYLQSTIAPQAPGDADHANPPGEPITAPHPPEDSASSSESAHLSAAYDRLIRLIESYHTCPVQERSTRFYEAMTQAANIRMYEQIRRAK